MSLLSKDPEIKSWQISIRNIALQVANRHYNHYWDIKVFYEPLLMVEISLVLARCHITINVYNPIKKMRIWIELTYNASSSTFYVDCITKQFDHSPLKFSIWDIKKPNIEIYLSLDEMVEINNMLENVYNQTEFDVCSYGNFQNICKN